MWLLVAALVCCANGFERARPRGVARGAARSAPAAAAPRRAARRAQPPVPSAPSEATIEYEMDHFLNNEFVKRGDVSLRFVRGKQEVTFGASSLDQASADAFRDLVASDGYYRVRLRPKGASSGPSASVRACSLQSSSFLEAFTFQADETGAVLGLDYRTPVSTCGARGKIASAGTSFKSKGRVSTGAEGRRPDMAKLAGIGEKPKAPEKGFFQKYWMYILIGFFVFVALR